MRSALVAANRAAQVGEVDLHEGAGEHEDGERGDAEAERQGEDPADPVAHHALVLDVVGGSTD